MVEIYQSLPTHTTHYPLRDITTLTNSQNIHMNSHTKVYLVSVHYMNMQKNNEHLHNQEDFLATLQSFLGLYWNPLFKLSTRILWSRFLHAFFNVKKFLIEA